MSESKHSHSFLAHFLLSIVALFYGANYSIAGIVLKETNLSPFGFILVRISIGMVLFFATYMCFAREKIDTSDFTKFSLCAFFGVGLNQLTFFEGLKRTSTIHASLLMTVTPILVMLFAFLFKQEKITLVRIIGILSGMCGACLLILNYGIDKGESSLIGDVYIFINATSFAIYMILVRKLMVKYHPITVSFVTFSIGFLIVLPFGWSSVTNTNWSGFEKNHWYALIFVIVASTYLAYLFNNLAIKMTSATIVSSYIYLQPLIAGWISVFFFGASIHIYHLISLVLIFLGVFLVSFGVPKFILSSIK